MDLRQRQPWRRRLPARLGTAALWLGSLSLLGPLKLAGVLALSASLLPSALVFDSLRRQRGDTPQLLQAAPTTATLPWQLARAEVAEQFCLAETLLFQARHARICTVVYDSEGRLAELLLPNPAAPMQAVASPIKVGSAAGAFHSRGEIHATLASRVDQPLTTSTPDAHLAG